jgi:hypothetical protein
MFKDMKEAAFTLTKDNQDVQTQVSASENSQAPANTVSTETQKSEDESKHISNT